MTKRLHLPIIDQDKIDKLHDASLYLLGKVGMKVQGKDVTRLLLDYGCREAGDRILFPEEILEKALSAVPREITLYSKNGTPLICLGGKEQQYFGTHADQLEIIDPITGTVRPFLREDTSLMCRLANGLKNISFILAVGMSSNVPPEIQSQIAFIDTVKHCDKVINFSANDVQGLIDIIEIASTIAGGLEQLGDKPYLFFYCEPIPPLTHPKASVEKLQLAAEVKIPVVYMPFCMMGGTAVMSLSGALAQCNAEVLAGLVITQAVNEGAPFIYGAMPSIFDMKTTIGSYAAPEFHLLVAAAAAMADYYGLPFYGTAGCSDSRHVDEQAVAEVSMQLFSTVLSKADLVHDIGVMDHCNSVSPEMIVLANEIIDGLNSYARGINFDDLQEALEVIEAVGPGGHFLSEEHTLNNFKSIWYPEIFSREMKNKEVSEVRTKIREIIIRTGNEEKSTGFDEELLKDLYRFEKRLYERVK